MHFQRRTHVSKFKGWWQRAATVAAMTEQQRRQHVVRTQLSLLSLMGLVTLA